MNILKSILNEFSPERQTATPLAAIATQVEDQSLTSVDRCSKCNSLRLWQPHGQSTWFCMACDPPPARSMVARQTIDPTINAEALGTPTIKQSVAYVLGHTEPAQVSCGGNLVDYLAFKTHPVCSCGCHMVVETTWSDGVVTFECASCAAGIAAKQVKQGP